MKRIGYAVGRVLRFFRRIASFFTKELVQMRRQPRLILMLIFGPFLILLVFGLGYSTSSRPLKTVLVLPSSAGLPTDQATYADLFIQPFVLDSISQDREQAVERLQAGEIDVVIAFPDGVVEQIQSGQQATIDVLYDELDPIERSWLNYYAYVQTNELNRRIVLEILQRQPPENLTAAALAGGGGDLSSALVGSGDKSIPPSVLVSPFRASGTNIAPTTPDYVAFYAPGVLALLVQHIAVTLTALALVRERLLGAVELFRVSPVRPGEMIAGKYLSYFLQTAVFAALLVVLMAYGLDIPFLGDPVWLAAVLVVLIAASLSVGFLISAVSRSETQAVQFSMLVLLASVFFSGFFLPLENLLPVVRPLSYVLPVTYGVQALQNLMLRGTVPAQWVILSLVGIALLAVVAATWTFRRGFRPE